MPGLIQKNNPEFNGSNAIFLKSAFKKSIQSQWCMVLANAKFDWSEKTSFRFILVESEPFFEQILQAFELPIS
jgi:hypothetical protein